MNRLSKYYHHPYFLYVLRTVVLIVGAIFFSGGCPTESSEQKEKVAFANFTGKWRLISSYDLADSSFINSAWIELQSDSMFYSNVSFYLHADSLKYHYLNGRWSTAYYYQDRHDGPPGYLINLKIDSTIKTWELTGGGTKDSSMLWSDRFSFAIKYSWKIY